MDISFPERSLTQYCGCCTVSQYRKIVREYIRASEMLLELDDLTEDEQELVRNVLDRVSAGSVEWTRSPDIAD